MKNVVSKASTISKKTISSRDEKDEETKQKKRKIQFCPKSDEVIQFDLDNAGFQYEEIFTVIDDDNNLSLDSLSEEIFVHSYDNFEDEESNIETTPKIKVLIDREYFMNEYQALITQHRFLSRKNSILQRKVIEFYYKRKLEQVTEEHSDEYYAHFQHSYEKSINDFSNQMQIWDRKKISLEKLTEELHETVNSKKKYLLKLEHTLFSRERHIGSIVIHKLLNRKKQTDALIEKLISRQEMKIKNISKIRFEYIILRNKLSKLQAKLEQVNKITNNLSLMDFEEQRLENTMCTDKIDEKEAEIVKYRDSLSITIQQLGHIREKIHRMAQIKVYKRYSFINTHYSVKKIREYTNTLKVEAYKNRAKIKDLTKDKELILYPQLLQHMEKNLKQEELLTKKLEHLQQIEKKNGQKLMALKQTIEETVNALKKNTYVALYIERFKKNSLCRQSLFNSFVTDHEQITQTPE